MIDLLEREMRVHDIRPIDSNKCQCMGFELSFEDCMKKLKSAISENKRIKLRLWEDLAETISKRQAGDSDPVMRNLFIPAIQSLYTLAYQFQELKENGVTDDLKQAINSDSESFSGLAMSKVIEFRLAIEWLHHLIRKDLYICALITRYKRELRQQRQIGASGTAGPWSNVDLPMQERVFKWDDIEEEVAGREKDKRNQSRYTMGLENYGKGDFSPNEGFYWREMRNEPYSFSDSSANPYPHRNLLWV